MVNAVQEVADAVGDVIRPVADVVGDVVRPVADTAADVLRPVGNAILDNPEVRTVVNVAFASNPATAWAVPLINTANAVDKGANLEEAATTLFVSTVGAGAADAVGDIVAESITDQVGSTVANFVADTGVNVVTNGGDIGAAILDSGLASTGAVSKTVGKIVDTVGIDTSTELGKSLNDALEAGVTAEIKGEDGVQAASIAAISDTVINPILEKGEDLSPEALGDVSKLVSTAIVAGAKGDNVYDAINSELDAVVTEDLRNLVKEKVASFLTPPEEPVVEEPVVEEPVVEEPIIEEDLPPAAGDDFFGEDPIDGLGPLGSREEDSQLTPSAPTGMSLEDAQADFETIDAPPAKIPYRGPTDPSDLFPQTKTAEEELDAAGISFEPDQLKKPSLSEAEILGDPKTFTGPVGAGIGPETTDEDFQSQLSGILGEESGVDLGVLSKKMLDEVVTGFDDTIYNVGKGAFEAWALTVKGGANSADFLINEWRNTVDKDPSRFFRNAAGKIVADLNADSDYFKSKISTTNYIRQLEALPAEELTFGEALPGGSIARDRFVGMYEGVYYPDGRPYGTDKFATFLNAAEEFGDVATDIAVLALTGPLVGSAIVATAGYLEGQADSADRIRKEIETAIENGVLDDNVGWQTTLADSGGDVEKAITKVEQKLYKYTAMAGSFELVGDVITAKAAVGTLGIKTIGDLYTKLSPKQRKALGIPINITTATGVGGLTEAAQTAITEKALKDYGISTKTETGGAFLLGAAGQGGAVAVANSVKGIQDELKRRYEAGTLSLQERSYVENKIINSDGEFSGTPTEILGTDTTTSMSEAELATEALKNMGLDDALIKDVLEEAGIDTDSDSVVDMINEISNTGGTTPDSIQKIADETGQSIKDISNAATFMVRSKETTDSIAKIKEEVENTGGLSIDTAKEIESSSPLTMLDINNISTSTLSAKDRDTLIRTINGEYASGNEQQMASIAHVIRNRTFDSRFPNTVAEVSLDGSKFDSNSTGEYAQFSTWNAPEKGGNTLTNIDPNSDQYKKIGKIVDKVFSGEIADNTGGAVNYWNPDVANPTWGDAVLAQHKDGGTKVGDHIFGGSVNTDVGDVNTIVATILGKDPSAVTEQDINTVTDTAALVDTALDQDSGRTIGQTASDLTTTTDTAINTATDISPVLNTDPQEPPEDELLQTLYGRRVKVDPPELADIGYQYDFSSIFANPVQENMFTDPYKQYTNNTSSDLFNYEANIDDLSTGTPYASYSDATDRLLNILRSKT